MYLLCRLDMQCHENPKHICCHPLPLFGIHKRNATFFCNCPASLLNCCQTKTFSPHKRASGKKNTLKRLGQWPRANSPSLSNHALIPSIWNLPQHVSRLKDVLAVVWVWEAAAVCCVFWILPHQSLHLPRYECGDCTDGFSGNRLIWLAHKARTIYPLWEETLCKPGC